MSATKHPVTKARYEDGTIIEAEYLYRGITIERNDSVSNGYYGRWTGRISVGNARKIIHSTRENLLAEIDSILESRNASPTESDLLAALGPCGK